MVDALEKIDNAHETNLIDEEEVLEILISKKKIQVENDKK
jgi:hypothetical protein